MESSAEIAQKLAADPQFRALSRDRQEALFAEALKRSGVAQKSDEKKPGLLDALLESMSGQVGAAVAGPVGAGIARSAGALRGGAEPGEALKQGAATAATQGAYMAAGALGGPKLLGGMKGPVGATVRAAASPAGAGVITGLETLRRTGSPVAALGAGAGTYLGGKGLSRGLGALMKRIAPAAEAAAPAAAAETGAAQGFAVPRPAQVAAPTRMGPSVTTSSAPPGTIGGMMQGPAPAPGTLGQTMRGPAPVAASPVSAAPVAAAPSAEAAAMQLTQRVREGAAKLGLPPDKAKLYEQVAKEVIDAVMPGRSQPLSTVTQSGSPSQLATILSDKYGTTMGLNSPHTAQTFINGVLKMAGITMKPQGLGMAPVLR